MAELTQADHAAERWLWWVGDQDSVEQDALYNIGSYATREAAIAAGLRDEDDGGFYIIEARTSGDEDDRDEDDREPFIEARNMEFINREAWQS
ncbi:hypothetical protein [Sphingomonas elodea]|uniref:hypothetical protein n=1 Tax=Sphingomonas elodea TaxID=179878 RepID=UPI000263108B|nr:hypothetical protein [Sphingomonas elodea]